MDLQQGGADVAELLASSELVDGAGHAVIWEQPDVFNRAVRAFVDRHGAGRSSARPA